MAFGRTPVERTQSEDAMNKILQRDSAWHESHLEDMASAPPRPHPFDFDSWAEYLTADDEWKAGMRAGHAPVDEDL